MRRQKQISPAGFVCLLMLLGLITVLGPAQAQVSSDTTLRTDTLTGRPRAGDSLASKATDSVAGTKPDTGAAAERPAAPKPPSPPPIDSAFNAACNPPPPSTPAASLLLVTFSPTLTEPERRNIVSKVGGTFVGVAASGERYVRISEGSTRAAADSLVLYLGVAQVSERPCQLVAPGAR